MNKLNWKGWLVLAAEILVVAAIVFVLVENRVSNYNWERGVETRVELASEGTVDIIDVRRSGDSFTIVQYLANEMTEQEYEKLTEEIYNAVEDAGKGFFRTVLARPNRDSSRWYAYTVVTCPTSLWLDKIYDSCEFDSPIWAELDNKNTRWANK
jgi:hypothetical protein